MKKENFNFFLLTAVVSAAVAFGVSRLEREEIKDTNVLENVNFKSGYNTAPSATKFRTVNMEQDQYPDFTYAAESAVDAVVFVEVTIKSKQNYQIDPFFRFFFGDENIPDGRGREKKASGSGVIIRPDGYIVTNNHVVENATDIEVTLNNKKKFKATVVGTDPATDVALIKIDETGLPSIPFGDSETLRLGEWVLAIGSPLGLTGTITAGIVSAKGRSMPNYSGEFKIESFIQTDAAVNPGNSGGALVTKDGRLVGINTAIISQTGAYSGYSFAVPSNIVAKIVEDLIDFGDVKRAFLGVVMSPITEKIYEEMKLSSMNGVYVNEVVKGSAADNAGMREGDIIISIDGKVVTDGANVQERVNSFRPGDTAEFIVIRKGKAKTLKVEFQGTVKKTGTIQSDGTTAFYGASLDKVSKEVKERLGISGGVVVKSISEGKMRNAGVPEGFIIMYVNEKKVNKPSDVVAIAEKARRAIVIEGVTSYGKAKYYVFGKDE